MSLMSGIYILLAIVGALLMLAPRMTAAEVGRVARTINDQNPWAGELLLRLLGLAILLNYGLALLDDAGLLHTGAK